MTTHSRKGGAESGPTKEKEKVLETAVGREGGRVKGQ
jgi:hypothetical protein